MSLLFFRLSPRDMLLLLVTVFSVFGGSLARLQKNERPCYGGEVEFPETTRSLLWRGPLYFTPSNGGERKILFEDGEAKDPRLKVSYVSVRLTDLTKKDEGVYEVSFGGKRSLEVLRLKILDCAEKIFKDYMHNLEYVISDKVQYLEYNPPDNKDIPLILWNRTNSLNNDRRRGNVQRNVWRIPGVTQADNGFYNFRRGDKSLDSRILLTVKENTRFYDPKVNEHLLITNPFTGGPWTVTFKQETEDEWVTMMKDGRLVHGDDIFSERITIQSYGIQIYPVESTDSGTFEFRDQQGNLALSVQVEVFHESHHASNVNTYIVVFVVALLLGICCCCCCFCKKRCCKKDKSADAATEGTAVTYHDKSAPTATGPVVYYHGTNQPTGPSYSNQPYPSVYPPHPVNPPAYTEPAAVSIEPPPSQPNTAMYPTHPTLMYPPLSEVGPPTSQGSAAAPTFSSDVFSSDAEPRFELKGMTFPSAPPLGSDVTISDVYNSDKLNFL
ncbi:uncharacterized protein LOC105920148 [Fundulus heteroclitus]|uniref:uncharacterized protein LOC105920148 n=1 Tax=Fundulus heteroclitus TaxID=8078 RepID=UPI00165C4949|nr:uncharacterized protein LOC105920148 [Fundulus heteroclitus]